MHPNLDPLSLQGDKVSYKHRRNTMLCCRSIELAGYVIKSY